MILYDADRCAAGWRARLRDRLRAALGSAADAPWADDLAAAVAVFISGQAGARPVRDDDADAAVGAALCALGRPECALRLLGGGAGPSLWRAALAPEAPPALRLAALRRWARPTAGAARAGRVWTLDLGRLFRDEPTGLELARHRRLAAVLDALAAALPAAEGLDALALRTPAGAGRRDAARFEEWRALCRERLADAAARRGWPRAPDIVRADLRA